LQQIIQDKVKEKEMFKLKVVVKSLQVIASGVVVLACLALPAAAQSFQVANSTNGRQVTAAPISQIVASLNSGINNAQWTANVANNQANYATQVGNNAQNTANNATNTANWAAGTANAANNTANAAYGLANTAESHAQHTYGKTRDTWLNYCYITNGNVFACNMVAAATFPGM
jgi:hypothetical protein